MRQPAVVDGVEVDGAIRGCCGRFCASGTDRGGTDRADVEFADAVGRGIERELALGRLALLPSRHERLTPDEEPPRARAVAAAEIGELLSVGADLASERLLVRLAEDADEVSPLLLEKV